MRMDVPEAVIDGLQLQIIPCGDDQKKLVFGCCEVGAMIPPGLWYMQDRRLLTGPVSKVADPAFVELRRREDVSEKHWLMVDNLDGGGQEDRIRETQYVSIKDDKMLGLLEDKKSGVVVSFKKPKFESGMIPNGVFLYYIIFMTSVFP
jgi:hypothetical protein